MMGLHAAWRPEPAALGRHSGRVLEALADAFAAPTAPFPAPSATSMRRDARGWLHATPVGQRLAVRGALVGLDLVARVTSPRTGFAARSRTARLLLLERLGRRSASLEAAVDALGRIAVLAYWSDRAVLATLKRIPPAEAAGAPGAAPGRLGYPPSSGSGPDASPFSAGSADSRGLT